MEGCSGPAAQVRPSGPRSSGCGQLQAKLPGVLRQPWEQSERLGLHSSTSSSQKQEGWGAGATVGGGGSQRRPRRGATSLLTHVTVLPSPAWSTLALVRSGADASVKARLGADGWGTFDRRRELGKAGSQGQPPSSTQRPPQRPQAPGSPSQVRAPGCGFLQPWQHTVCVCRTSRLTSRQATR